MKGSFLFVLAVLTVSIASSQSRDERQIRGLLADQTAAWNEGDIPRFMQGYWESDSLVFVGKNGPTYGYRQTLENYKKNYPDASHMGRLKFDLLEVRRLSPEYYFVIGKWNLERSIGNVGGSFTLLLRKINGRWAIVADHSS